MRLWSFGKTKQIGNDDLCASSNSIHITSFLRIQTKIMFDQDLTQDKNAT